MNFIRQVVLYGIRYGFGSYGLPSIIGNIKEIDGKLLLFSDDSIYTLKNKNACIIKEKGIFFLNKCFNKNSII